jgi:hypothetical protein
MTSTQKTYDVVFSDDLNMNSKGFKQDPEYCFDYIISHNGTDHSYFADYKGHRVSIVCNETGENLMTTTVY